MKTTSPYALFCRFFFTLLFCCFATVAFAQKTNNESKQTKAPTIQQSIDDLKAFVNSGLKYIKDNGETKAYEEFNKPNGKFRQNNLYLFVFGFNGKALAHGGDPKYFVGKNMFNAKDKFGTPYFQLFVEAANRGGGVVSYYWPRPDTGVLQYKTSYIAPINNGSFIGAGVFRSLEIQKSQEAKINELKSFVDSGVDYVKKNGAKEAYKEFSNQHGQFTKKDWYIFVVDYNGTILAHGGDPKKMIGTSIADLKDIFDTPLLMMFTEAAKSGGGVVSYYWPHYTEKSAVRFKTSYIEPLNDQTFIGAGYYED